MDRHHLLFDRVSWTARPEARILREDKSLIVTMDREEHNELHKFCTEIPVLGYHALNRTLQFYEPGTTPLKSIDNLMTAIEKAVNHPKAHRLEKELGALSVWGLDLERPFISENSYD